MSDREKMKQDLTGYLLNDLGVVTDAKRIATGIILYMTHQGYIAFDINGEQLK